MRKVWRRVRRNEGRVIAQAIIAGFPPLRSGFEPRSGRVVFMVDKVTLAQVFCEYFGFPYKFSFHRLLHIHYLQVSSRTSTIDKLVADVPSGLSLTPLQETKKKKTKRRNEIGDEIKPRRKRIYREKGRMKQRWMRKRRR
jgi:hypothetical protein